MPEPLQPGSHLSPDQLSAFAENALPEHERLAALTHLSACADCRQVVFLAQQADPALPTPASAVETPRRGWFTLPQIFGAATAALACSLILVLIVHHQHQEQQPVTTAQIQPQPAIVTPAPTPAPSAAPTPPKPAADKSAKLSPATTHTIPIEPAKLTPLPAKIVPPLLGRTAADAGMAAARAPEARQKYADTFANSNTVAALPPPMAPAGITGMPQPSAAPQRARTLGSYSAENIQSDSIAANTSAVTAPAPPAATSAGASVQIANGAVLQNLPLAARAKVNGAAVRLAAIPPQLPSKLAAVSVLNSAGRTLALDSAGALFLSLDRGKNWTAVTTQWSGKVIQISLAPTPARLYLQQPAQAQTQTQSQVDKSVNGLPQQQSPIPTAGFELTTATGTVYVSTDGLTWHVR